VPPRGFSARPTTDMAKESLFNILANRFDFEGLTVLDLFAGTGSISYEFASRGAGGIICVEKDFKSAAFINLTARQLDFPIQCIRTDVFAFLKSCRRKFQVIFADPPYDLEGAERVVDVVFEKQLLADEGLLVYEHSGRVDFYGHPRFCESRSYGKVQFTFFAEK
jgi:16S rRNA (guanine(966)-N(2))-methyltransferase RsmD